MVASHRIKVIELFAIEIALLKYTYLNASGLSVGLNTDQVYWVNQNVDILRWQNPSKDAQFCNLHRKNA